MLLCWNGCSVPPSTREVRDARRAAERLFSALAAHDVAAARRLASCPLPDAASFRGATILRTDSLRLVAPSALDSLAAAAEESSERAALELAGAGEETADSLWLRSQAMKRRAELWRDARRAASASAPGDSLRVLRICRMRVRIRWGGPRVGPEPVDREHVLRILAAPGGHWIVFSLLPRDREPAGI